MPRLLPVLLFFCCTGMQVTHAASFDSAILPLLKQHCSDCHSAGVAEGGLSLDALGNDLADAATFQRWERIHDRLQAGEMPPPDDSVLAADVRDPLVADLARQLTSAHAAGKGTVLRRLNRNEYENTLNDLFGTHVDLVSSLPEDGRSGEFDNVGESLDISMVQLQRYLEAIDSVLDAAIASRSVPPPAETRSASYADTREAERFIGSAWHKLDDGAVVFYHAPGYPTGMLREANATVSGRYEVTIEGYAHQSDVPITFELAATTFARGLEEPTYGYFAVAPGAPQNVTTEVWLEKGFMIKITPQGLTDPDNKIRKDGIANYRGPGLAILSVQLRGPLTDEFPSRGHTLLFSDLQRVEVEPKNPRDKTRRDYRAKFDVRSDDLPAEVFRSLERVASAAFRRPVTDAQVQPFADLFASDRKSGASVEEAYRTAVAAVFCSPEFLYLCEPVGRLDDHALATRLSYFLTRTAPDDRLRELADDEKFSSDSQTIASEVERLLADPRSDRFFEDFADSWLNLRDIEFTAPDEDLFPEFDPYLQHSMLGETRKFLRYLIAENRPVVELVRSDYAMLNERLAEHYGITDVDGPQIRRIELAEGSVRGGLLSQAAVLKVSANGTNTSPVVRGVYVTERLLGKEAPPPPPGVPGVEPDVRGTVSLRELLERHRDNDQCRSCHEMIDPPGFALESFDPVGGWRERFRSLGEGERVEKVVKGRKVRYRLGPTVDATGEWSGGPSFDGFAQFREQLASDPETLYRTMAVKLLTFATGRPMGFSDRREIERIVSEGAASDYRLGDLVRHVVASDIFQSK